MVFDADYRLGSRHLDWRGSPFLIASHLGDQFIGISSFAPAKASFKRRILLGPAHARGSRSEDTTAQSQGGTMSLASTPVADEQDPEGVSLEDFHSG
jgi:hypothetical protein